MKVLFAVGLKIDLVLTLEILTAYLNNSLLKKLFVYPAHQISLRVFSFEYITKKRKIAKC